MKTITYLNGQHEACEFYRSDVGGEVEEFVHWDAVLEEARLYHLFEDIIDVEYFFKNFRINHKCSPTETR